MRFDFLIRGVKVYSHEVKARAKVKKIQEQVKRTKDSTENIKENFLFHVCVRLV